MATGDIFPFDNSNSVHMNGSLKYGVASGTTASINPGEPVQKLAGAAYVTRGVTNMPTTTNRIVGVAASTSTETASVSGTVDVIPAQTGMIWLITPNVAATWNTQAKYNALLGSRVLIDLTTNSFTLLAADGAGNGCIVEYLDIAKYPGKVAISFSPLSNYLNV
jgi:hypothetical protein